MGGGGTQRTYRGFSNSPPKKFFLILNCKSGLPLQRDWSHFRWGVSQGKNKNRTFVELAQSRKTEHSIVITSYVQ